MSNFKFKVAFRPVKSILRDVADHSYIIVQKDDSPSVYDLLKCWGVENRDNERPYFDVSGQNIYCIANHYRGKEDSASLGTYGINGVCHQATNLFLYAAGRRTMNPLDQVSPKGLFVSYATYGIYGTGRVGINPFFSYWRAHYYEPALAECTLQKAESDKIQIDTPMAMSKMELAAQEIINLHLSEANAKGNTDSLSSQYTNGNNLVTKELEVLFRHLVPEVKFDEAIISAHQYFQKEKRLALEKLGASMAKDSNTAQIDQCINKINTSAIEFLATLRDSIGQELFLKLNGGNEKLYAPINPEIAQKESLSMLNALKP